MKSALTLVESWCLNHEQVANLKLFYSQTKDQCLVFNLWNSLKKKFNYQNRQKFLVLCSTENYAAIIWCSRCSTETVENAMPSLISITGAMNTDALESMLYVEPLHIHIEGRARSTVLRFHHYLSKKITDMHGCGTKWLNNHWNLPCDLTFTFT